MSRAWLAWVIVPPAVNVRSICQIFFIKMNCHIRIMQACSMNSPVNGHKCTFLRWWGHSLTFIQHAVSPYE